MKKIFGLMMIVVCIVTMFTLSASAQENDVKYYYRVKLNTKIEGDESSQDIDLYYALHGILINGTNEVLDACDADGRENREAGCVRFSVGETQKSSELMFYSKEPLCGVRLLEDGGGLDGIDYYDKQYLLRFDVQGQKPGIEHAMFIEQMHLILGFKDGGEPILSQPASVPVFKVGYNAPPLISGVSEDEAYYTSQKAVIYDEDLASVTMNGETVDFTGDTATVILPGDMSKAYELVATDEDGLQTQMLVVMHCLDELLWRVDEITINNVKRTDEEGILATIEDLDLWIDEETATQAEKKKLADMKAEMEALLSRIDEAQDCKNSESVLKTKEITAQNAMPKDRAALEKAAADLETALSVYGGNYSAEEKTQIKTDYARVSEALDAVVKQMLESIPKTGDRSRAGWWLTLLIVSVTSMFFGKKSMRDAQ